MPPPPTPSGSNTMTSHATYGSNTSVGSNTMPSHATATSTRTNKGKCPLIPKKGKPAKSSASSSKAGSKGGSSSKGGSRGGVSKRGRGSSKRGGCFIPLQGLRDESDEYQFKMDMEAMYKMEAEQIINEYEQTRIRKLLKDNDEDDQFWEDRGLLEEPNDDKGLLEDVYAGKRLIIEDDSLQVGANLPTQESTVEANPKPTRSKKIKPTQDPNQMIIFHKNRGRYERIFN
ncbi:hypothetical protein Tco_0400237 [Tanacetum coccineum]